MSHSSLLNVRVVAGREWAGDGCVAGVLGAAGCGPDGVRTRVLAGWEDLRSREDAAGLRAGDAIFLSPDHRVDPLLSLYVQSAGVRCQIKGLLIHDVRWCWPVTRIGTGS